MILVVVELKLLAYLLFLRSTSTNTCIEEQHEYKVAAVGVGLPITAVCVYCGALLALICVVNGFSKSILAMSGLTSAL